MRYTKTGRLRFVSHRDFARALERALRRAQVPMAYSAGFTPHPKISYVGAAPTGVASDAEYLEIGLAEYRDPEQLRQALDASLPDGLDVVELVEASPGSLADRMQASVWEVRLPGVEVETLRRAVEALLAADTVMVTRLMKNGPREIDVRAPIVRAQVAAAPEESTTGDTPEGAVTSSDDACAILEMVVRHVTPAVRPDDVLSGLRQVAELTPPSPPVAARRAQGPLDEAGVVADPLAPDHEAAAQATTQAAPGSEPLGERAVGPQAG